MTDTPEHPDPWDVSLPAPFDAREIYDYATSVGAERRGQRRRRQLVLTICGCLVVALTAAGIGLSGGDGGETSIRVATQASIPRAPVRTNETVPPQKHRGHAAAPPRIAAPPAPPITSPCRAFARLTSSFSASLTAFHSLPILDTTTTEPPPETTTTTPTTTTTLPPPTTTTTRPSPPSTTPTTRHKKPPPRIRVSPDTAFTPPAFPGDPPSPALPLLRPRRTRC